MSQKNIQFVINSLKDVSKEAIPILFILSILVWIGFIFLYFRGLKAYLRELGRELTIPEIDRLDELAVISYRTDEEEEEFEILREKREKLRSEGILKYYILSFILLAAAAIALLRFEYLLKWLKEFY